MGEWDEIFHARRQEEWEEFDSVGKATFCVSANVSYVRWFLFQKMYVVKMHVTHKKISGQGMYVQVHFYCYKKLISRYFVVFGI